MSGSTAVVRYFFSPLYYPRNHWAILRWWESRRLFYNLVVGGAGMLTVAAGLVLIGFPPAGIRGVAMAVLAYGLMANLFYSLGAPADYFLRRLLADDGGPVAQALFRYGVAFAVGLTLLPIPIMGIGWVIRLFIG
jgi:hypothetical protein